MFKYFLSVAIPLVLLLCSGCQHGAGPESFQANQSVASIREVLAQDPTLWLPELKDADPAQLAQTPGGQEVLVWAKEALESPETPETTYTLYRRFSSKGERRPYEAPYFDKRLLLTQETMLVWLGGDTQRLSRVEDLIWSICEETTWVLPAHEKGPEFVDLFSAETGALLAHVARLLDKQLPDEIQDRIYKEIDQRIFTNYLAHGRDFWYDCGRNNWTGVCAGSVGQSFLMLEPDLDRQAEAVLLVQEQLGRFLENAFEEDGVCLEGIGYWNYGLIRHVAFAEMLRVRSQGKVDMLSEEKLVRIAHYPLAVSLGKNSFASFSDAKEKSSVIPYLAALFADRMGVESLRGLSGSMVDWRLGTVLRNLLWAGKATEAMPQPEDIVLVESGIARLVGSVADTPLALAAKAGSNNEPHNQNDVGSFILRIGETTYLTDPGRGLYSKAYFSRDRYKNTFANSYGHSVPRIGGALQKNGKAYRGTLEQVGPKSIAIRFEKAYGLSALSKARRELSVTDSGVTLQDSFAFSDQGAAVEEAFLTWLPTEVHGSIADIVSEEGTLRIEASQGSFQVELLKEACQENNKPELLRRISLEAPAASKHDLCFTMTYHPAP